MAHLIEVNNGVASYVENGRKERAWHGLGQVYDGQICVKEALNGLTTYFQNDKKYTSEELKFNSVMNGHAANKLQMAYDMLIAV